MVAVSCPVASGTSPLYVRHAASLKRGWTPDQQTFKLLAEAVRSPLRSPQSLKKWDEIAYRGFRAAVVGGTTGAAEDDRPRNTKALLEALKGAELTLSGKEQSRTSQSQSNSPDDNLDDLGTSVNDPGTSSLLEALRAIDSRDGRNSRRGISQSAVEQSPPSSLDGPSSASQSRNLIRVGSLVDIVLKKDQVNGRLTRGAVAKVLTNSQDHPRGIKVRLKFGEIGRVHEIIAPPSSDAAASEGAVVSTGMKDWMYQNEDRENSTEEGFSGRTESESQTPRGDKPQRKRVEQGTKIFVSGLSREATNEDLTEASRAVDGVVDAFVVTNKQKRCQGYGFVQLVGDVEAGLAKMNELEVRGQKLTAAVSVERKPNTGGGSNGSEGGRQVNKREGERGGQKTRRMESQSENGASLLLEAFRGVQEKRKARPTGGRKSRRGGGGPRAWAEEEEDADETGALGAFMGEDDGQVGAESGESSGEPRVITIKDDTSKQPDPEQPSMGQLVMAALERARKEKGIETGPAAGAAEKGVAQASGEATSDDELEHVLLKPLRIDPQWTEKIEALSRRLEEVKRLPVEI